MGVVVRFGAIVGSGTAVPSDTGVTATGEGVLSGVLAGPGIGVERIVEPLQATIKMATAIAEGLARLRIMVIPVIPTMADMIADEIRPSGYRSIIVTGDAAIGGTDALIILCCGGPVAE